MPAKDDYLNALGYKQDTARQNLPLAQWLVSKLPAAAGGLFAHEVYQLLTTKWFTELAGKYGPDVVGSIGLAVIAWALDHSVVFRRSDDLSEGFTDGMMGRGAPAVWNTIKGGYSWLVDGLTSKPKARSQGLLSANNGQPSLDSAPQALAEMISLLADSPRTRDLLASDLITMMERRGMQIDQAARSNFANCIGDLASQYKQ